MVDLDKYTMRINEVVTVKPKTPQQQRVAALRNQKDAAARALKAEQTRQKTQRLQQQQQKLQQQLSTVHATAAKP
jgi:hypothetical protein